VFHQLAPSQMGCDKLETRDQKFTIALVIF
jgi:hypothetical protein